MKKINKRFYLTLKSFVHSPFPKHSKGKYIPSITQGHLSHGEFNLLWALV